MKEMLMYCLCLGILMLINIACSVYYNINVKDIKFDIYKLLNGIYKSLIIGLSFIGLTFVFDKVPSLKETVAQFFNLEEFDPIVLMNGALAYYGYLAIKSLADALNVKVIKDSK